jgi:transposase
VIQAPKPEPRIVRYELTDYEWAAIKPFLPNKPRGVPRVNDRRVLNGIFWDPALGCAVARPAKELWPVHHLLQSLRLLATGGRLGWDYERAGRHA